MKNMNTRTLTRVALLVAIELVMKAIGPAPCSRSAR